VLVEGVEQTLRPQQQQQPFAVTVGIIVAEPVEEVDGNLEVIREVNPLLVPVLVPVPALVLDHLQLAEEDHHVSSLLLISKRYYSF
jgi:hypothetical protein